MNQKSPNNPHLRLAAPLADEPSCPTPDPIQDASDPRWVLAQRTADALQGHVLPAPAQAQLLALATRLNMTPFAARLVIAIVQEQTRRGFPLHAYPHNALAHLAHVPQGQPPAAVTSHIAPPSLPDPVAPSEQQTVASGLLPIVATALIIFGCEILLLWQFLG